MSKGFPGSVIYFRCSIFLLLLLPHLRYQRVYLENGKRVHRQGNKREMLHIRNSPSGNATELGRKWCRNAIGPAFVWFY
ncbi:hypothetical protein EDD15DRAFT_2288417 [Pisolithus albus]|nr:hypothetical protein EDD15DRAFT_2288417 [Pisolithus albus]